MSKEINYKSDFSFILKLKDAQGEYIGFPDYDFWGRLSTSGYGHYDFSCRGGVCVNCVNENGEIKVIYNNDGSLGTGDLKVEFHALLPDDSYPDGDEAVVTPEPLDITLVKGKAAPPSDLEVEMILPYIRGKSLTFADLTDEERAVLTGNIQADAQAKLTAALDDFDAKSSQALSEFNTQSDTALESLQTTSQQVTESVLAVESQVTTNEQTRQANEQQRIGNETLRQERESERNTAEEERLQNESDRKARDKERKELDATIAANEKQRTESEQQRVTAESERVTNEQTRKENERERISNETLRKEHESEREEAEQKRVENEQSRVTAEETRTNDYYNLVENTNQSLADAQQAKVIAEDAANTAKEQATYAKEQGDYAKEQADNLGANVDDRLKALEEKMDMYHADEAYQNKDYCVGAWTDDSASPDADEIYGNKDICWDWRFYLIDCTDNAGITTHPVGELSRKNLFRFADGRFAPVVGITEDMQADSTLELYRLVDGEYQMYCEAGAYKAESYLEDVLRPAVEANPEDTSAAKLYKLVDDEYVEAHALLPWETTETKYSIGVGYPQELYLLDQVQGKSGKVWKGVFTKPTVWDGIDVTDYKLARTAIGASLVTTIGFKSRCFFFLYGDGDSGTTSAKGSNDICDMFYNNRHYPLVWNSALNYMDWARANNADTKAPYPCAEGGYHALNTFTTCIEVAMGTKYIHNPNLYSSGISSNDACNSEAAWLYNGGGRYRIQGAEKWSYAKMNDSTIYVDASGTRQNLTKVCNSEYPKEACMESQIAYSWAQEFGIGESKRYAAYDGLYWYSEVATNSERALINARLYKLMTTTLHAYDSAGAEVDYDFEVILRIGIYNGMPLSGDIHSTFCGGLEQIGIYYGTPGWGIKCYSEWDQTRWVYDKTALQANAGTFLCEKTYPYLGEATNVSLNYTRKRMSYTPRMIVSGGNNFTYECFYVYQWAVWNTNVVNRRHRLAARFRSSAGNGSCSPRGSFNIYQEVGYTYSDIGGSAQWLIS